MGGEKSQVKGKQAQLVEQNYSNNIMLLAFSTLESVCCKILNADSSSAAKRFGRQDKVDYSLKSMQELIVQLKTHLLIFKASKQSMDSDFKGFVFPKQFSKQTAIDQLETFRLICETYGNKTLTGFCDDFKQILLGNYSNLSFEGSDVRANYGPKEREDQKKSLLKDGIHATNIMNELRDEVEKGGVQNPSDLTVKLNTPKVDYGKCSKNSRKQVQ